MSSILRASQLLLSTLKEAPADAVAVSHQLLVRAGFVRQLSAGLYSLLPLGLRSLRKLEAILHHEMQAVGGQEFLLPSLHPAELRSYRQLPQCWYQIGLKFRDEPRPKGGLLRLREFHMKDAYSFDLDLASLDAVFARMRGAYERIFARCELEALPAEAFSGAMGGSESIEFVVRTPAGEDQVVHCRACGYVANIEVASSRVAPLVDSRTELKEFATPGVVTIDGLTAPPYSVAANRQLKTLVYVADEKPIVAVVRGDHTLNEAKLQTATGATHVRPARIDEVFGLMGAHPGSLGTVGFSASRVLVDSALAGRSNTVTGANRDGFHLSGVDVDRDVLSGEHARVADLRVASAGEGCPACDGTLDSFAALEVGHIFKLGTRYSERMGATVRDDGGTEVPLAMGSYGIGLERLLGAAIEQHHGSDAGRRTRIGCAGRRSDRPALSAGPGRVLRPAKRSP